MPDECDGCTRSSEDLRTSSTLVSGTMNDNCYITPIDVVDRLLCKKRHWFHGDPTIKLIGEQASFGVLRFDFGDEIVEQRVWIKDRNQILDAAHLAIKNFAKLAQEIEEVWS